MVKIKPKSSNFYLFFLCSETGWSFHCTWFCKFPVQNWHVTFKVMQNGKKRVKVFENIYPVSRQKRE